MDSATTKAQLIDTAYQQEFGLPRLVSFEFGTIPLEKAQRLLDDPVEFRIAAREFWLSHGGSKGGLTRDELAEVCIQIFEQLGEWEDWTQHPTEEQLDEVFAQTDTDGSGLIEFEEFHDAAKRVLTKIRHSKSARMLANQSKLPKLPIPKLEDTIARYRAAISWFPSIKGREKEMDEMFDELRGPKGQAIHAALQGYAANRYSYVEEFWSGMYGRWRSPLPVNVSPAVLFLQNNKPAFNRPLFKAARFVSLFLGIGDAVNLQLLDPDYVRGVPLCMWEYQLLFARTRIPDETCDYNVVTAPLAITEIEYAGVQQIRRSPRYVMVLKQNRIFFVDAYHSDGSSLSAMELLGEFEKIDMACRDGVVGPALGALTASDRTTWAKDRARLQALSEHNAELLAKIDSCVLTLCLDSITPDPTSSTALAWALHGDGRNRWFDKSICIGVSANGVCGMMFEHSACDAWPYIRVVVQMSREMHDASWSETASTQTARPLKERIEEAKFDLDDGLHRSIATAEESVDKLIAKTAVRYLTFTKFGKNGIVRHNVSPDAMLQAALILAFYLTKGYKPNTYSAGGTKQFLHGRTECVRSSTPEMFAFVDAYVKAFGGVPGTRDAERKVPTFDERCELNRLLRVAIDVHVRRMLEAKFGQGCDRHMFALKCVAASGQVPEEYVPRLFNDPVFGESMGFNLSTSNVPANPYALSQVFGPVTDDGFGVCYSVYNGHLTFGVTCWKDDNGESLIDAFRGNLEAMIEDIEGLVLPAVPRIERWKAAAASRFMMFAMLMTQKFGWLTRVPLIGAILRNTPMVGRMLTFKAHAPAL